MFFLVGVGACCDIDGVKILFLRFVSVGCVDGCVAGSFVMAAGAYLLSIADGAVGRFVFLHAFSGDCVGGGQSLAMDAGPLEHEGVLCGWFSTDEAFFDAFFCVGARIRRELICAGCVQGVCSIVGLPTIDMAAGGWRIVLYLRSGSDGLVVVCICFVRFVCQLKMKLS
ncbi:unnamed protein product [Urochloa humidicola]